MFIKAMFIQFMTWSLSSRLPFAVLILDWVNLVDWVNSQSRALQYNSISGLSSYCQKCSMYIWANQFMLSLHVFCSPNNEVGWLAPLLVTFPSQTTARQLSGNYNHVTGLKQEFTVSAGKHTNRYECDFRVCLKEYSKIGAPIDRQSCR